YDSDNAGYKAAERAFQTLAPYGLIVKVAMLPKGEDPDSYIRNQGPEAFAGLVKNALDFVDYQLASVGSRRDLTEMRERVKFAEEMAENVKLFDTLVARETTILRVANSLGISVEIMRKLVTKALKAKPQRADAKNSAPNERPGEKLMAAQDATALMLCRFALSDPEILLWLREQGDRKILQDLPGTELLSHIWLGKFDPASPESLQGHLLTLDRDDETALTQLLHMTPPPGGLKGAQHAYEILFINRLQQQKQRLQTQLRQPNLDPQEADDMTRESIEIHRELNEALRRVAESGKTPG
ncbi:MAG TPA: toprim domain-containing protein, partial [Prosthecobacter sp.]